MNLNISSMNFRANAVNENGIPYYKSNKGAIAGAVLAVPAVAIHLSPLANSTKKYEASMRELFTSLNLKPGANDEKLIREGVKMLERQKKFAVPYAIIAGICTLGSGILFDKIRNNKAKAAANDLAAGNFNNIYANGGEIDYSMSGIPYYKSNNGVRYGAATGAICGLIRGCMDSMQVKKANVASILSPMVLFTLGGMLMGSIAQSSANKAAEKETYIK